MHGKKSREEAEIFFQISPSQNTNSFFFGLTSCMGGLKQQEKNRVD